ncbi:GerAB/ArcD/ProY family transporter [Shimazuella kribbensis]|uniref:GerAB/ArcD/ProY family transporter n=1 Tax=Shimazuella kribbensis TaxID=139808 RepID=UPI001FE0BC79|nr:GerAB/ArcD/ProY family transporter [Shimazuella kribbensis]
MQMVKKNSSITQGQLMFFILQAQIGVGILSLPHVLQLTAKGGAWISVLFAGLFLQLVIIIHWALCKLYPSDNIYSFLPKIVGKYLGNLLSLIYSGYFLFTAGMILVRLLEIIHKWMLQETPKWAVLILILVLSIYLVRENLRIITRFFVITSFIIVVMVILSLVGYMNVDFTYIFPITEAGWVNILKTIKDATPAMLGFEILLVFYPMVEGQSNGKLKAVSVANLLTTLFYTFEVFTSLIIFSPEELPLVPEPMLYMLKAFSFHIVDRIDLLFLALWFVITFTSLTAYLYAGIVGLGQLFHKGQHKKSLLYVPFIVFLISFIPDDTFTILYYERMISVAFRILIIGLPIFFLMIGYVRKKRREQTI